MRVLYVAVTLAVFLLVSGAEEKKAEGKKEEKKKDEEDVGTVIGIDLGTTYSCVGVYRNGRVEIIANDQGNRITPSYVAFTPQGERLIGDAAKNQLTTNPENTLFDAKRLIGRRWNEPSVQKDVKLYPFKVVSRDDKPHMQVSVDTKKKSFSPEEVSAMVLGKMRETAEAYLGTKVTHAVVTVPAYFNDAQRSATKNAGVIAGLNVMRIINEPTAAAIAYGLDKKAGEMNILVFDLGGGTFDVSLLTIDNGVFEVLATNGDTHLGGEDFDQRVMDHFIKLYKKKTGKDISKNNRAVQKLRREAEKAKRSLSSQHETRIEIESFFEGADFSETLTRAKFEELNLDLFRSTMKPVDNVLKDAGLEKKDVNEIILVGGSTRIPKVQDLVKAYFNGKKPNKGVNPDEAVAFGAAVQAGVLGGAQMQGDLVLVDVCPLTLGIAMEGDVFAPVIKRNSVIPTKKSQIFTTVEDNQDIVENAVYEGERSMCTDNHFLGKFDLTGIPPAPRGTPQIEVTFEIDANGILKVTAKELGTGQIGSITINQNDNKLSKEDIERMVKDAEKFAEEDKLVRDRVNAKADLESTVYNVRTQLKDKERLGGKLNKEDKEALTKAVEEQMKWLDDNPEASLEDLKKHKEDFENVLTPITTKLYKKQNEDRSRGRPPPPPPRPGADKETADEQKDEL